MVPRAFEVSLVVVLIFAASVSAQTERDNRWVTRTEFFSDGFFWNGVDQKMTIVPVNDTFGNPTFVPAMSLAGDAQFLDGTGVGEIPPSFLVCGRDPAVDRGVLQLAEWSPQSAAYVSPAGGTYQETGSDFVGVAWARASQLLFLLDADKQQIVMSSYGVGDPLPVTWSLVLDSTTEPLLAAADGLQLTVREEGTDVFLNVSDERAPGANERRIIQLTPEGTVVSVVSVMALAGSAAAQEKDEEQGIAELIEELKEDRGWESAATELLRIGAPAVPGLVRAFQDGLDREPEEQIWKIRVLDLLAVMGSDAAEAAPELYESLDDLPWQLLARGLHAYAEVAPHAGMWTYVSRWSGSPSGRVTVGLIRRGHDSSVIEVTVRAADDETRIAAGEEIFQEVLRLDFRCREDSWQVQGLEQIQATVAGVLGSAGPLKPRDVSRLEVSVELLERHGSEAEESLVPLAEFVRQRFTRSEITDELSLKIAGAMLRISTDDPVVAVAHGCVLTDHLDPGVRRNAAMSIGLLGPDGAGGVRDLITAIGDSDAGVVAEAITALGMIGPAAKDAIPTLEKLAEHEDRQIAQRAKAALRQVRGR